MFQPIRLKQLAAVNGCQLEIIQNEMFIETSKLDGDARTSWRGQTRTLRSLFLDFGKETHV